MKIVSTKEYTKMVEKASPNSPTLMNCTRAFISGGIICTLGEALCKLYKYAGFELKEARALVSMSLILIAAVLTMLKVYDNIGKHAGAGIVIPITGFGNSIVAPAMEFKSEGFIVGLGGKMFSISGPVIIYGTIASILFGVVVFIFKLY